MRADQWSAARAQFARTSTLVHCVLPCLGRNEIDRQASGVQFVTGEDTTGRFHASHGQAEPAGEHILSEPKIVADLAKATLTPNPKVDWDAWSGNYALVRDAIAQTYPKIFENFNEPSRTSWYPARPCRASGRSRTTISSPQLLRPARRGMGRSYPCLAIPVAHLAGSPKTLGYAIVTLNTLGVAEHVVRVEA